MRASTWNLREGFDKVRWGNDVGTVRALYPGAGERKRRVGVNPSTGEKLVQNAGLYVGDGGFAVPVPSNGIRLLLSIGWDDGGVSDISLSSDGGDERYEGLSAEEWMKVIRAYEQKTAEALGLSPFDSEAEEQSWDLDGLRVTLGREWDNFSFSFERLRAGGGNPN